MKTKTAHVKLTLNYTTVIIPNFPLESLDVLLNANEMTHSWSGEGYDYLTHNPDTIHVEIIPTLPISRAEHDIQVAQRKAEEAAKVTTEELG